MRCINKRGGALWGDQNIYILYTTTSQPVQPHIHVYTCDKFSEHMMIYDTSYFSSKNSSIGREMHIILSYPSFQYTHRDLLMGWIPGAFTCDRVVIVNCALCCVRDLQQMGKINQQRKIKRTERKRGYLFKVTNLPWIGMWWGSRIRWASCVCAYVWR